jgi:hypothetical protein
MIRRGIQGTLLLIAFSLVLVPAQAQLQPPRSGTFQPDLPSSDTAALVKAASLNPGLAGGIAGVAVLGDPEDAAEIVGDIIAALPPGALNPAAAEVAATAARVLPQHAVEIVGTAAEAAAYAAGRAARPPKPGTPADQAAQAVLTAAATAAVLELQAVLVAVDQLANTQPATDVAAALTKASVIGAMRATSAATWEAARAAGARPDEAASLGDEAARLAATTVTRGAITGAVLAYGLAASTDVLQVRARIDDAPADAARERTAAVLAIATGVTRAAVAASLTLSKDQGKDAPMAIASRITDAAAGETERLVAAVGATVASRAGAYGPDAEQLGREAAQPVRDQIGLAAAQAVLEVIPAANIQTMSRAAGPTLAKALTTTIDAAEPPK